MPAAVPWSTLTADQEKSLVLCTSRTVSVTCEVLNLDLTVVRDITSMLDNTSGSVQWNGPATVHRGCTLTLALDQELDWGTQLVRLAMTLTDDITGLSAWAYLGTFALAAPDLNAGSVIENEDSQIYGLTAYTVTGQDVTASLDRQIGYSYTAPGVDDSDPPAPVPVLTNASALLTAAGFSAATVHIDGSRATAPMTDDFPWPLIITPGTSTTDAPAPPVLPLDAPAPGTGATTWRTATNDLMGLVTYRAVWAERDGTLQLDPAVDPAVATPRFTFNAQPVEGEPATVVPIEAPRTRSLSVTNNNKWIFLWSNMAGGELPSDDNEGIIRVQNDTDGPSSIQARGGDPRGVDPTQVSITASSSDDFASQADAYVTAAKRKVRTFKVNTVVFPDAGHFDTFLYADTETVGAAAVKVQATASTLYLTGANMSWTWEQVA